MAIILDIIALKKSRRKRIYDTIVVDKMLKKPLILKDINGFLHFMQIDFTALNPDFETN